MKRIAKTMMPVILIVMMIALTAEAQPGPGNGRQRGPQMRQNQRGPEMGPMDEQGPGPRQGQGMRGPGRGAGLRLMGVLRELDLTQEQHKQIRTIMDEHKEAAQAGQEAVQKVRTSLHEAVVEGADEVAIRAIANNLAQAIGDQAIAQVTVTGKVKAVLTEEQQKAFDELIKKAPGRDRGPQRRGPQQRMQGRGQRGEYRGDDELQGPGPRQPRRFRQRPRD